MGSLKRLCAVHLSTPDQQQLRGAGSPVPAPSAACLAELPRAGGEPPCAGSVSRSRFASFVLRGARASGTCGNPDGNHRPVSAPTAWLICNLVRLSLEMIPALLGIIIITKKKKYCNQGGWLCCLCLRMPAIFSYTFHLFLPQFHSA